MKKGAVILMQINRDRIFAAKQKKAAMDVDTILSNKHTEITNNPSSIECAKFLQTFKSQPWNYIAENFDMLISLPMDTTDYAKSMLESYRFDADILTDCKSLIENMIDDDNDYVVNLESLLTTVNEQLSYKESLEYLREETHFMFAKSNMKKLFITESNIADELDVLIYNVNHDPESIFEYEELVRRVKMDNKREYFSDYSDLLRANTEFAKALKHDPPMDVINLITDLPVIMVNKMIDNKCEPHEFKAFKKVLDIEMRYATKALASGEYPKHRLVKIYMRKFNIAINEANSRMTKAYVNESSMIMEGIISKKLINFFTGKANSAEKANSKNVNIPKAKITAADCKKAYTNWYLTWLIEKDESEDVANMLNKIFMNNFNRVPNSYMVLDCSRFNTEYSIPKKMSNYTDNDLVFLMCSYDHIPSKNIAGTKSQLNCRYFTDVVDNQVRIVMDKNPSYKPKDYISMDNINAARKYLNSVSESMESIADMQPDIIHEDRPASEIYDYDPDYSDIETMITDMIFKEGDLDFEDIEKLTRLENYINTHFEIVEETVAGKAARAEKVVRKATNGISRPGSKIKRTTTAIKRIPQPFFNMVNRVVNDIKRMDKNERREKIITGGFRLKISRLITRGIAIIAGGTLIKAGLGGAAIIAPLLTLIGMYAMIAKDKRLDAKERRKILNELESELTIVNEKIEDARGSDDKEKKYQLMRTKQKLELEIERIKHGVDN